MARPAMEVVMTPLHSGRAQTLLTGLVLASAFPADAATVVWETTLDAPGVESSVQAAAADASGDFIVTGFHKVDGTSRCRTAKFSGATGAVVWQRSSPAEFGPCEPIALALDGAGNAVVASRTFDTIGFAAGSRTTKYAAADGAVVWERIFGNPADGVDELAAVGTDGAGNAIVTGRFLAGTDPDWRTIKYASATGAIAWESAYAGPGGRDDRPAAIAVDAAGNAFVGGGSALGSLTADAVVAKYDAASGAPLWTRILPASTGLKVNDALDIALDGAGDCLLLWSDSSFGVSVSVTLTRLAGPDGAILWSAADARPGESFRHGMVAVDAQGDIVVSGKKWGIGISDPDWRTTKYAGTDGAMQWSRIFNSGFLDSVSGLAFDAAGNPIVVGASTSQSGGEMTTIKYFAEDGETAWEHYHNGPAPGGGFAKFAAAVPGAVLIAGDLGAIPAGGPEVRRWHVMKVSDAPSAPRPIPLDFNADGRADFVFRHTDGTTAIWLMDGMATASIGGIFPDSLGATIVAIADFNGDGKADLLWRFLFGHAISLMDGTGFLATAGILGLGTGWNPVLTVDLDGDGKADIILRHTDGRHIAWIMDGTTVVRGFPVFGAGSGWRAVAAYHYVSTRRESILAEHTDGRLSLVSTDGTAVTGNPLIPFPSDLRFVLLGDFDGDLTSDILAKGSDGAYWLLKSAAQYSYQTTQILPPGTGWEIKLAADFDGDRRTDLVLAHPDGRHGIWLMVGTRVVASGGILPAGSGWTVVAARDTSGDGHADLLLHHASGVYAIGLVNGTSMPTAAGVVGPPWLLVP